MIDHRSLTKNPRQYFHEQLGEKQIFIIKIKVPRRTQPSDAALLEKPKARNERSSLLNLFSFTSVPHGQRYGASMSKF